MVIADWHMHTTFSGDGRSTMEEMCKEALRIGLVEICFTDHHDRGVEDFTLDIPAYIKSIAQMKEQFPGLIIRTGIEVGDMPEQRHLIQEDIRLLNPEYFLLSTHMVDGIDPYFPDLYYAGRTRAQGITAYLESVLETATIWQGYHALAHLGYAGRYAPVGETATPMCYEDGPALIDEILRQVMAHDAALEINTAKENTIPGGDILRRYAQLGGRKVVLGSDAHDIYGLAHKFDVAEKLALSLGLVIQNRQSTP